MPHNYLAALTCQSYGDFCFSIFFFLLLKGKKQEDLIVHTYKLVVHLRKEKKTFIIKITLSRARLDEERHCRHWR